MSTLRRRFLLTSRKFAPNASIIFKQEYGIFYVLDNDGKEVKVTGIEGKYTGVYGNTMRLLMISDKSSYFNIYANSVVKTKNKTFKIGDLIYSNYLRFESAKIDTFVEKIVKYTITVETYGPYVSGYSYNLRITYGDIVREIPYSSSIKNVEIPINDDFSIVFNTSGTASWYIVPKSYIEESGKNFQININNRYLIATRIQLLKKVFLAF